MPAADAEPAYLDALEIQDCATARALYQQRRDPVAPWCGDIEVFDSTVGDVQDGGCCGTGADYGDSACVPVDVVTRGGAPELPDGDNPWGYVLVREAGGQRWRIADEGLG